jgi:hypothetical protein
VSVFARIHYLVLKGLGLDFIKLKPSEVLSTGLP